LRVVCEERPFLAAALLLLEIRVQRFNESVMQSVFLPQLSHHIVPQPP
jgi:hypothetical protein